LQTAPAANSVRQTQRPQTAIDLVPPSTAAATTALSQPPLDIDDPVLESVLNGGLGPEATLRFLKAAVRNLVQERRDLQGLVRERDKAAAAAETQLKNFVAEAGKTDRSVKDRQLQIDKLQRTCGRACCALKHRPTPGVWMVGLFFLRPV
jgi:hypothetical protein